MRTRKAIFSAITIALTGSFVVPALAQDGDVKPVDIKQVMQADVKPKDEARRLFIEMMTLSRLPIAEQSKHIATLYPQFMQMPKGQLLCISICYVRAPLPPNAAKLSPEELADFIQKRNSSHLLSEARFIGRQVLQAHLGLVKPLIQADLHDVQSTRKRRGLQALQEMGRGQIGEVIADFSSAENPLLQWLSGFFDDVRQIFAQGELTQEAMQTFHYLGDPRAIPVLIEQDRQRPTQFYQVLGNLSRHAPPHPTLLALLDSLDSTLRRQALWALHGADEQIMFPYVQRLLNDPAPEVRSIAASRAFGFTSENFARLRPTLLPLLSDADTQVRYSVAMGFGFLKKDKVALPATLALLKDGNCNNSMRAQALDWVRQLTGTSFPNFGFDLNALSDDARRQPNTRNQEALLKLEQWIKTNASTPDTPVAPRTLS